MAAVYTEAESVLSAPVNVCLHMDTLPPPRLYMMVLGRFAWPRAAVCLQTEKSSPAA